MRVRISILSALMIFLPVKGLPGQDVTIYQARKFFRNRCYQEIAKLRCTPECHLFAFPETNGQLSFKVRGKNRIIEAYRDSWALMIFRVISPNADEVELLQSGQISYSEVYDHLKTGDYLGHPVPCK